MERMGKVESFVEGPRWARFDLFLKKLAQQLGLDCQIERKTTLCREHVFYRLDGSESDLQQAIRVIEQSVNEWNAA